MLIKQLNKKGWMIFITSSIIVIILALFVMNRGNGGSMEEPYHPFKSQEAKETYVAYYDEHAKHWPVASEEKMVKTSFGQTFVRISGPEGGPPLVSLPGDSENSLVLFSSPSRISSIGGDLGPVSDVRTLLVVWRVGVKTGLFFFF